VEGDSLPQNRKLRKFAKELDVKFQRQGGDKILLTSNKERLLGLLKRSRESRSYKNLETVWSLQTGSACLDEASY